MEIEKLKTFIKEIYYSSEATSNKWKRGKTLIIGGSSLYPGAVILAAGNAINGANGYTAVCVPDSIKDIVFSKIPASEIRFEIKNEDDDFLEWNESISRYDSLLFGNGVKISDKNALFLKKILLKYSGYLIIDASGLNLLSMIDKEIVSNSKATIIITPHLGELSKLTDENLVDASEEKYRSFAGDFAKNYHLNILLKSYKSYLYTANGGERINSWPTSAACLGRAGTGDCLAGYLAALFASNGKRYEAIDLIDFADSIIHQVGMSEEREMGALFSPDLIADSVRRIIPSLAKKK
ncbi:MAG: NAD(P)H-hydrate dehydratase [Bacilli bacterium]|nr:NAD(P)H-hydrate dehydratase [Bacilli bacterium]